MNSLHLLLSTVDKALSTNKDALLLDDNFNNSLVAIDDDDSQIVTRLDPLDIITSSTNEKEEQLYYEEEYEQLEEEKSNKFIWKLLYIIFFIPNFLFYKPTLYLLYVITYPIRLANDYVFGLNSEEKVDMDDRSKQESPKNLLPTLSQSIGTDLINTGKKNSNNNNTISTISEEDDDDLEFEISSESSLLADKLKSPTSQRSTLEDDDELNLVQKGQQKQQQQQQASDQQSSSQIQQTQKQQLKKKLKRKKQRFVFPRLLINNNFDLNNPPSSIKKKTLVLDLDETLIHSLSRHNSSVFSKSKGKMIEIKLNNKLATLYYIYKRPFVDEFFNIVKNWFDLVCFTASIKEYADPVINFLEEDFINNIGTKLFENNNTGNLFQKRYYRNDCIWEKGVGYIKDLSVLTGETPVQQEQQQQNIADETPTKSNNVRGRPLLHEDSVSENSSRSSSLRNNRTDSKAQTVDPSRLIIIDNSPVSYSMNKDNGIMIEGWINDPNDLELMNLLPLLNSLRFTSDVRAVLSLKEGEPAFGDL